MYISRKGTAFTVNANLDEEEEMINKQARERKSVRTIITPEIRGLLIFGGKSIAHVMHKNGPFSLISFWREKRGPFRQQWEGDRKQTENTRKKERERERERM